MSFQNLNKDELQNVADFFVKDVEAADEDKGPTKKELIAALAAGDEDDAPVTWEDYNDVYLPAKAEGADKPADPEAEELSDKKEPEPVEEEEDDSPKVLVKMERKNPRFDIRGYTFTKDHPFHSVDEATAEYLVTKAEGFRLAMPKEVADFYN
jgi:hypothetical protein